MSERMPAEEVSRLMQETKAELAGAYRSLHTQVLDEIAAQTVRAEVARSLKLMSFDEFCAAEPAVRAESARR